jgi:hypothetical protein
MKRVDFTNAVGELIRFAKERNIPVIIDWALRDKWAQARMFRNGLSKCDGEIKISKHQMGLAVDIYVMTPAGRISEDLVAYSMLHDKWDELGGGQRIRWDKGHFEWE